MFKALFFSNDVHCLIIAVINREKKQEFLYLAHVLFSDLHKQGAFDVFILWK